MIIDNQIAFCGGQDLSLGKWDISDHEFDNPSRDLGSDMIFTQWLKVIQYGT